jgi:hypothetical protein
VGTLIDKATERYRQAVAERLAEPVLAVGSFVRSGLPQSFLLAVTPERVHAFAYSGRDGSVRVEFELASWDRESVTVTAERGRIRTRLALRPSARDEPVVCDAASGPLTDRLVELLQQPASR